MVGFAEMEAQTGVVPSRTRHASSRSLALRGGRQNGSNISSSDSTRIFRTILSPASLLFPREFFGWHLANALDPPLCAASIRCIICIGYVQNAFPGCSQRSTGKVVRSESMVGWRFPTNAEEPLASAVIVICRKTRHCRQALGGRQIRPARSSRDCSPLLTSEDFFDL